MNTFTEKLQAERQKEKEFRELYWMWYRECVKRHGRQLINTNRSSFTQRSFRRILEQYDSLEAAREAMMTVDLPPTEDDSIPEDTDPLELPDIQTTATQD